MGLPNYLATLDLSPGVAQKLTQQYGPPSVDEFAPPTAEEQQRYGVSPEQAARLANANAVAAATPGQSPAAPTVEPGWTPELDTKRREEGKQRAALDAANPQGPTGSDGFPTYKDLSGQGGVAPGGGAPAMPLQKIAAHWQPGTRSFSAQYGMNPDELQSGQYHRDVASGQRMIGADKHLEAAQAQAQADVTYAEAHARASDEAAQRLARIQEERAIYTQNEKAKMETLAQQASAKVDPEVVNGPLGGQVLAAIGIGLGQFGAAINGGPNTAYAIVQDGINRRLKMEQDKITSAGRALEGRRGLYAQNLAEFGDKERATLATKVALLDQAKAAMDQKYAKAKGTANEAAYHDMVAMFETDRAQAADQFAKLTHTQRAEQGNEHYVPTQYVGGVGGAGQKGKDALYVPTLGGYARDEKTAQDLNKKAAIRTQINEDLHRIDQLLNKSKGLSSITDFDEMQRVRAEIDGLKHNVLQRTTVLREQGAMSKGDKDVAEVASQLSNVDPMAKTNAAIERARAGVRNVAVLHQRDHRLDGEANGIQLGQEQYVAGPSGPEPRRVLQGKTKTVTKETQNFDDVIEKPKGVPAK